MGRRAGRDRNFLLWTLVPFIAAWSGEELMESGISFEEAATVRPDGGINIVCASVLRSGLTLPPDYVCMKNQCGPMWNSENGKILRQTDSEWSDRAPAYERQYSGEALRVLALRERDRTERLSGDEYAWLAKRGYVRTGGGAGSEWQIVELADGSIRDRLLDVGTRIKKRHKAAFDLLKAPYAEAVLDSAPEHMRRVRQYELQFVFHSDGWFLLHCITELLESGKLHLPAEEQRKALTTLIFPEK